ncbi:MAG: hypothetical protein ACK41T_10600 [Pseudobdellovibrio sp.]
MSRLEELQENLKNTFQTYWDKIQESPTYGNLNDRYQALSPNGQKMTQIVAGVLVFGVITYIPLSQLQLSSETITQFEEKRSLIRDLFKTYRETPAAPPIVGAPEGQKLVANIQGSLQSSQLIPEQISSVNIIQAESKLIPSSLLSSAVEVKLNKLNLRQIIDIGTKISNISNAVKIKDMIIQANTELAGYFDVTYKVFSLKAPMPQISQEPPDVRGKKNNANADDN